MVKPGDQRPCADILILYQDIVKERYPNLVDSWPLLNGWNLIYSRYKGWQIIVIRDVSHTSLCSANGIDDVPARVIGTEHIDADNKEIVRENLYKYFQVKPRDAILIYGSAGLSGQELSVELAAMFNKHREALGMGSMKLFLSHKGLDKPKVREFKNVLQLIGFDPWLDEDAMPAGTKLERGILKGFEDSCAAIFFVTANYKDEGYLETEVDYAIAESRKKGNKFAIITLVFGEGDMKGTVPNLLQGYVWKEPKSDLEALNEILRALPVQVGSVRWR